ncbi:unnamed protein product [Chrysoparadoxa australica]
MNLGDRFMRVAKANLNSLLAKVEDPEKVLEQAVEDMQRDLIKVRQSYAEVTATQKRLERQKEQADKLGEEWYKRAQLALQKGDENLAREALSRRQTQVDTSESLVGQIGVQNDAIDRLYTSMQALEGKITEAKGKKDQLIARARTAKTSQKVNDMLSDVGGNNSMSAFDRMQEKVEMLETKAEISSEMSGLAGGGLEAQFKALEGGSAVDAELAALKNNMLGGSTGAGETKVLPASPSALDDEIAAMKKEMDSES